jgi:hypothetical protein
MPMMGFPIPGNYKNESPSRFEASVREVLQYIPLMGVMARVKK